MRVVILSNTDPTSSLLFKELCSNTGFNLTGVAYTSTLTSKKTYKSGLVDIFKRTGKSYFFYMCFWNGIFLLKEKLYNLLKIRLDASSQKRFFSFRNYAIQRNIPVVDSADFNSPAFISLMKEWNPDVIITRINQILKKEILELPRYGCLCCHSSLLPDYAGIAAEFYNLLNDEEFAGFSFFKMTEELDKGKILLQGRLKIEKEDTVFSLTKRNAAHGGRLLIETLNNIKNSHASPNKQISGGRYYSWPDAKAVAEFKAKKKKFVGLREVFRHIIS